MIYLVACTKQKSIMPRPVMAKDLYISDWFAKAKAYVEATRAAWFILSAKHYLLLPETVIVPYNESLHDYPADTRRKWAHHVGAQIVAWLPCKNDEIIILAGWTYCEYLTEYLEMQGYTVRTPLARMGIGSQKKWLVERLLFTCHNCGAQCATAPDPPAKAVCEDCCEDHEYVYEKGERQSLCKHCNKQRPEDW